MKPLHVVAQYIETLSQTTFRRLLGIVITGVLGCIIALWYVMHTINMGVARDITSLQRKKSHVYTTRERLSVVQKSRLETLAILDKNVTIKGFLQDFATIHKVDLKTDFETTISTLEGNDIFEEVSMKATLARITTKQLVALLIDLARTPEVYIKEIKITRESGKKITALCTFGSLRRIQQTAE